MLIRISARMAEEWSSRGIADVIPDLPEFDCLGCVLDVTHDVARQILADCEFNADAQSGPESMPPGTRRAYRALDAQIRKAIV
ncbi:hypothetical protein [Burkholderia gladioli]|uniref:hypothetical protein n=1 Tax=Burkholderia gladioli TaxID=28095 RepID=UPI00164233BF|nr:hypothetical protein [Burkholderia gladioli]